LAGVIRSASLTNFAQVARQCGLDPSRLLRECGLPARCLDDPETVVPIDGVRDLLERSAAQSGVEGFALLMAETRRLSHLGPLGLLMREEPTPRLALDAFVTHGRRLNESLCLTVEEVSDVVVLRETVVVGHGGQVRQATELAIGVAFRTLQLLLGPAWRPRRVCFAHDPPRDRSIHERVFGRSVEFGHDFNGIVCARSDLARSNAEADPELARLARKMLATEPLGPDDDSAAKQVRELVITLLGTGTCTIDRAAQHLGIDRRTIHRRLQREHETFSGIVDAVRRELAERYLKDRRPLAEIASLLGFSASSGFSHWYRRQHDAPPSSRRAKSPPGTPGR
jgi:AraC-like DNA-binding protein